jgi:hypothetical protein
MEISHSHAELICAYDGVNGVNTGLFRRLLLWLLLCQLVLLIGFVRRFPPYPDVSFLGLRSFMYAIFRESQITT